MVSSLFLNTIKLNAQSIHHLWSSGLSGTDHKPSSHRHSKTPAGCHPLKGLTSCSLDFPATQKVFMDEHGHVQILEPWSTVLHLHRQQPTGPEDHREAVAAEDGSPASTPWRRPGLLSPAERMWTGRWRTWAQVEEDSRGPPAQIFWVLHVSEATASIPEEAYLQGEKGRITKCTDRSWKMEQTQTHFLIDSLVQLPIKKFINRSSKQTLS